MLCLIIFICCVDRQLELSRPKQANNLKGDLQTSISRALVEGCVSHYGERTFLENFLGKKIQTYREGNKLKLLNIRKK